MGTVWIREVPDSGDCRVAVRFDDGYESEAVILDPFSAEDAARLDWYFEKFPKDPFQDIGKSKLAAESIGVYGKALFRSCFMDAEARRRLDELFDRPGDTVRIEIWGSHRIQQFHWEALQDPESGRQLALEAALMRRLPIAERSPKLSPLSATLNVLVVTARPKGVDDVGYLNVSRPLVEALTESGIPLNLHVLRPGTFDSLVEHLARVQAADVGKTYQVVHFDLHGDILTYEDIALHSTSGNGADPGPEYFAGVKPYLAFESERECVPDFVPASEISTLLSSYGVQCVVLNACKSGKATDSTGVSVASEMVRAGIGMVLAMSYSVSVTMARIAIGYVYEALATGADPAEALRRARNELVRQKWRQISSKFHIVMEDWIVPVLYSNASVVWPNLVETRHLPARTHVTVGHDKFLGRDADVFVLERLIEEREPILVRGVVGVGKTALLKYLQSWWRHTGLTDTALRLDFGMAEPFSELVSACGPPPRKVREADDTKARDAAVAEWLHALKDRSLLIVDQLERVSRESAQESGRSRALLLGSILRVLQDAGSILVMASRGSEDWLAREGVRFRVHVLSTLDNATAETLGEATLSRLPDPLPLADVGVRRLFRLARRHPDSILGLLGALARCPSSGLAEAIGPKTAPDFLDLARLLPDAYVRIDDAFQSLTCRAREILLCLAPFGSNIHGGRLEIYRWFLEHQGLANLSNPQRWEEALAEALEAGLLVPSRDLARLFITSPLFPIYLRGRLAQDRAALAAPIMRAFATLYEEIGGDIAKLIQSSDENDTRRGLDSAAVEFENLLNAIHLQIEAGEGFSEIYRPLALFVRLDAQPQMEEEIRLFLLQQWARYRRAREIPNPLDWGGVFASFAAIHLQRGEMGIAEAWYRRALEMFGKSHGLQLSRRAVLSSGIEHQLGMIDLERHNWAEAKDHFDESLRIIREANLPEETGASTVHELGRLQAGKGLLAEAEQHYRRALQLFERRGDEQMLAPTWHELGILLARCDRESEASEAFLHAVVLNERFRNKRGCAANHHELGVVFHRQGRCDEAADHYLRAMNLSREILDHTGVAAAAYQRAKLEQGRNSIESALSYFALSLSVSSQHLGPEHKDRTIQEISRLWLLDSAESAVAKVAKVLGLGQSEAESVLRRVPHRFGEDELRRLKDVAVSERPSAVAARALIELHESDEWIGKMYEMAVSQGDLSSTEFLIGDALQKRAAPLACLGRVEEALKAIADALSHYEAALNAGDLEAFARSFVCIRQHFLLLVQLEDWASINAFIDRIVSFASTALLLKPELRRNIERTHYLLALRRSRGLVDIPPVQQARAEVLRLLDLISALPVEGREFVAPAQEQLARIDEQLSLAAAAEEASQVGIASWLSAVAGAVWLLVNLVIVARYRELVPWWREIPFLLLWTWYAVQGVGNLATFPSRPSGRIILAAGIPSLGMVAAVLENGWFTWLMIAAAARLLLWRGERFMTIPNRRSVAT